ncbi:hypothetical protein [Pseudomonas abietaniphila]|uniref:Uncharacterized protein n=1 Tax=Pseudomonas abietaniphila TaxID=89065 RepID=A0A1G8IES6_9PSED|nr:hypothetical protein [Pseudomonas abietaniphila]SDI17415.1 hypothetical protein SAMN05216605_11130 [Pseudomonas abietaniphila]
MNDANLKYPIPLTPPIVAVADPEDGLLKTVTLNGPVPVQVMVWPAAEPGYYFKLMLNGVTVGDKRIITKEDVAYEMITVHLDEQLLSEEGEYQLGYMTVSPNTESQSPSPELTLRVDRSKPGAALLGPMIFSNEEIGEQLTGLLPGYAGMAKGDVIQTLCNQANGPSHVVQADELTIRPIEITFKRELLESAGIETATIEYFVTDRAGNQSIISTPAMLKLHE